MTSRGLLVFLPVVASLFVFGLSFPPPASAQTQMVTASPGYINLGMPTSIVVTAPAPGSYSVVVAGPGGGEAQVGLTFTSAGQTQNVTYGSATSGFKTTVSQVGTYNVFVESNGQVLGSTAFYTTNQLVIDLQMVQAGTCTYVQQTVRGVRFVALFVVTYASNGALMGNATSKAGVTFTTPSQSVSNAIYEGDKWVGLIDPSWNFTGIGAWSPSANATDGLGNVGTFKYQGVPYLFLPATLTTNVQLGDAKTGQAVTSLYPGQTVNVVASVSYPAWTVEPFPGYAGPLNSTRGGVVTGLLGWGFYNSTTGAFGGVKPGGLIASVKLASPGGKGIWTGSFDVTSLPTIPSGAAYEVVVNALDAASPPNTGAAMISLPATTTQSVTTATSTQTLVQTSSSIPSWAYAAMALLLLVGVGIGYMAKRAKA